MILEQPRRLQWRRAAGCRSNLRQRSFGTFRPMRPRRWPRFKAARRRRLPQQERPPIHCGRKQSRRRRLITKRKPSGYTASSRCRRRITTCKCSATTRFIFCARGTTTTIPWPVRRATFPIRAIPAITRTHKEHRTLPLLQCTPSADVHLFSRRAAAPGGSNSAKRRSSGCRHRGRSMERRRVAANHWMHYRLQADVCAGVQPGTATPLRHCPTWRQRQSGSIREP